MKQLAMPLLVVVAVVGTIAMILILAPQTSSVPVAMQVGATIFEGSEDLLVMMMLFNSKSQTIPHEGIIAVAVHQVGGSIEYFQEWTLVKEKDFTRHAGEDGTMWFYEINIPLDQFISYSPTETYTGTVIFGTGIKDVSFARDFAIEE